MSATATVTEALKLRDDAHVAQIGDGVTAVVEGHVRAPLGRLGRALAGAVDALVGGATEAELAGIAIEAEGDAAALKLQLLLRRLAQGGWLTRSVCGDGEPLAVLIPIGHVMAPTAPPADLAQAVVLSRFALLRAQDGELRLETPLQAVYVRLHAPALASLVGLLARPGLTDDLVEAVPGIAPAAVRSVLRLLRDAAIVVSADAPETPSQQQWSFADLLMHARSRVGRNLGGFGGSYHREGDAQPLPAVKPPAADAIALPAVDLDAASAADPPFGQVLEGRRSVRVHDDEHPITTAQLGELLYRAARVRGVMFDGHQELSSRPYPGGGACYELEIYPLVNNCTGLQASLYHYDPARHSLELVAKPGPATILLSEYGRMTAVMQAAPQVVLLIAARFGRVMWKYESMAYALVLKQVGVMYQTLYLAATAMGLAPVGLGGGNSDAFCAATGTDFYEESSVGEFVIGSRPAGDLPLWGADPAPPAGNP